MDVTVSLLLLRAPATPFSLGEFPYPCRFQCFNWVFSNWMAALLLLLLVLLLFYDVRIRVWNGRGFQFLSRLIFLPYFVMIKELAFVSRCQTMVIWVFMIEELEFRITNLVGVYRIKYANFFELYQNLACGRERQNSRWIFHKECTNVIGVFWILFLFWTFFFWKKCAEFWIFLSSYFQEMICSMNSFSDTLCSATCKFTQNQNQEYVPIVLSKGKF